MYKLASLLPLAALALPSSAVAQQDMVTVQLPTFSMFTVSTTVLVPDRGSAYLGGVGRASAGSNQFGPAPAPAAMGAGGIDRQAAGVQVSVWIHDFRALEPTGISGNSALHLTGAANSAAAARETQTGRAPAALSVSDWKALRAQQAAEQQQEVIALAEKAAAAVEQGNTAAARIYLQMALRRADDTLRPTIAAELKNLTQTRVAERP
jgi:hypothetical protein